MICFGIEVILGKRKREDELGIDNEDQDQDESDDSLFGSISNDEGDLSKDQEDFYLHFMEFDLFTNNNNQQLLATPMYMQDDDSYRSYYKALKIHIKKIIKNDRYTNLIVDAVKQMHLLRMLATHLLN